MKYRGSSFYLNLLLDDIDKVNKHYYHQYGFLYIYNKLAHEVME